MLEAEHTPHVYPVVQCSVLEWYSPLIVGLHILLPALTSPSKDKKCNVIAMWKCSSPATALGVLRFLPHVPWHFAAWHQKVKEMGAGR